MIESARYNSLGDIDVIYNGKAYVVPKDVTGRYRDILDAWIAEGNAIEPYIIDIDLLRKKVKDSIKDEAIKRVGEVVDVGGFDFGPHAIFIYQHSWPQGSPSQALVDGKVIYDFAVSRLQMASNATRQQLENYDASSDGWP